jgi:flagellar basal-body rod modification protein FlgD
MAMTPLGAASAADTSTATTPGSSNATDAAATSARFLKLLVAQMQNQDPLNPMDNAAVTTQMAQINTVSGIQQLNTTMQQLSSQVVQMQALQGASLVGRSVIVPGNVLDIQQGVGQGGFQLDSAAGDVKVDMVAGSGQVVGTIDLGAQSAGMGSFSWPAGSYGNADGLTFRVTATTGATKLAPTALMRDTVDSVSLSGAGFSLELQHSGTTAYAKVLAFD